MDSTWKQVEIQMMHNHLIFIKCLLIRITHAQAINGDKKKPSCGIRALVLVS